MSATEYAIELARVVAYAALDKKGFDIVALDVSEHLAITDIFVVISAANERQVSAVVDAVDKAMHEHKAHRPRREGERENRWVLLDYIDIVVHVQHQEERELYSLGIPMFAPSHAFLTEMHCKHGVRRNFPSSTYPCSVHHSSPVSNVI